MYNAEANRAIEDEMRLFFVYKNLTAAVEMIKINTNTTAAHMFSIQGSACLSAVTVTDEKPHSHAAK